MGFFRIVSWLQGSAFWFALTAVAALTLPTMAIAQDAEADIRAKTERWFALWSPGGAPIDWEAFRPLYMEGEGAILVIDDFGDTVTTITSIDDYIATWKPVMAAGFQSWSIAPGEPIAYRISDTLAVASFLLIGDGLTTDGNRIAPRQRGSLIFQKNKADDWRIVEERLTTLPQEAPKSNMADDVRARIIAWGEAWVVGDDAEKFNLRPIAEEYYVSDLLAFDTSDDAGKTVIRGMDEFVATWQPFVRSWDIWEFNVLPDSIEVRPVTETMAWATLYIDNYGRAKDGAEFHGPAQGTLLMTKHDGAWKIAHEHISLPRKDPQE
ncbi:MAG: nuclear transport factor 2 family protein [Pseudomonadota bacterium]